MLHGVAAECKQEREQPNYGGYKDSGMTLSTLYLGNCDMIVYFAHADFHLYQQNSPGHQAFFTTTRDAVFQEQATGFFAR